MAIVFKKHFYILLSDIVELLGADPQTLTQEALNLGLKTHMLQGKVHLSPVDARKILENRGYTYPHKVISFQMLKGGVAKTTSALNFALRAHMYGARVLMLDLDQQANLSFSLGVDSLKVPVFIDLLENKENIQKALIEIEPGLSLLPSNLNNSVIERHLIQSNRNLSKIVKNQLDQVKDQFDLIVIDTAPALSALNTAVSCASSLVVLPVSPDKYTLFGLQKHLADLEVVKREFDAQFEHKILFTRFDSRESASSHYLEECMNKFGDEMMKSFVRNASEIKSSIATQKTIFDTKNNAKEDYDLVTRELMGLWI